LLGCDEVAGRVTTALSWSGGKDSALALWALRRRGTEPSALITTVTEDYERISMHGVRRALLEQQAAAAGIPLVVVAIPASCGNEIYEERMDRAFAEPTLGSVDSVAFGDLFLEDVREYREERLARVNRQAVFPLWGLNTAALAEEFVDACFGAVVSCLDPRRLNRSFAGRAYDAALLRDLPETVDPCGENGEFHTFAHRGPVFSRPVAFHPGEVVERDGFVFCDLLPAARASQASRRRANE
jgi:uncharacterized protein (TIGR00290 family)